MDRNIMEEQMIIGNIMTSFVEVKTNIVTLRYVAKIKRPTNAKDEGKLKDHKIFGMTKENGIHR